MHKKTGKRKICNSLYHKKWFRIMLVLVGIDMIILGIAFAIGIDIGKFTEYFPTVIRVIFGLMYVVTALFLIHYVMSYKKIKKESSFVCTHCIDEMQKTSE